MAGRILRSRRTLGALVVACGLLAPALTLAERNVDSALRRAAQADDLADIQHQLELGADPNAEWTLDRAASQTALGASILAGDVQAAQLLIDAGADVNHVPRRGDPPLMLAALAPRNGVQLVQLLLRHGADPDLPNAAGLSMRQQSRDDPRLRTLVDRAKPAAAAQLSAEDPLEVAMALHYKMLCDAGLPGYRIRVAPDYFRWRVSQARTLARLEAMPEFQIRLAGAKAAFAQARAAAAEAGDEELRLQMAALHRICEVSLIDQFRFGTPVSAAVASWSGDPSLELQPALHRTSAPAAAGAGMSANP